MPKAQLILIGGEAWTGKSTCARVLFTRLYNAAWLDGDDVWRVNPWSLDDPRLRTSDINLLEKTRALINTIKIDTSKKTPEAVVDEMLAVIR